MKTTKVVPGAMLEEEVVAGAAVELGTTGVELGGAGGELGGVGLEVGVTGQTVVVVPIVEVMTVVERAGQFLTEEAH